MGGMFSTQTELRLVQRKFQTIYGIIRAMMNDSGVEYVGIFAMDYGLNVLILLLIMEKS
jgi:hypothetical protein